MDKKTQIFLMEDGPMVVKGSFEIVLPDGEIVQVDVRNSEQVAFCRCGKSKKKPYCDNSHLG